MKEKKIKKVTGIHYASNRCQHYGRKLKNKGFPKYICLAWNCTELTRSMKNGNKRKG